MLCTKALDAYYGHFRALFSVDVEVAPGETVALIGANGAGKSTLLKALAGALPVPLPAVTLDGAAVGGRSERHQLAGGIALVPEGRRLFSTLTVKENFQVAARNGRRGPWTLARIVRELPVLESLMSRIASSLSGGQQQLVAIARSLLTNPEYLLCDEVSLGLSPLAVDEIYSVLGRVRSAGTAIVLVEQNMQRALTESDRYYCLQKGRVVLQGVSARADRPAVTLAYFGV